METHALISDHNKYPIGLREWEISKTTKKVQYKLKDLLRGDFFGHEELGEGDLNGSLATRICKVVATSDCEVLFMNKEEIIKMLGKEFPKVAQMYPGATPQEVNDKIEICRRLKKQSSKLFLHATNYNYVPNSSREMLANKQERQVRRLRPWMDKARSFKVMNPQVEEEIRRMKIIDVQHEKYRLHDTKQFILHF